MNIEKHTLTIYFLFLDELRLSGKLNMYASPSYIVDRFDISIQEAKDVFMKWNETFSEEPAFIRATRATGEIP